MRIVISSGHGKFVRGARGDPVPPNLDEVDEARRVVENVANYLEEARVDVITFHDDVSQSQGENLDRIVDFHNSQDDHELDVSVHFNAYEQTNKPMGTEVLWVTQEDLARKVSAAIAGAGGFTDRGPKYRDDLAFLNGTREKALLIETCFCDSVADSELYREYFDEICSAIAEAISGEDIAEGPEPPEPEGEVLFSTRGRCSYFGGPRDTGVDADEGLAFFYEVEDAPHLFLPHQPPGTGGLARRLNPGLFYVACRWDYSETPKDYLANPQRQALVRAQGREFLAWPADWGPNENTGRVADLSPGLMRALGLETDDEVEVIYPAPTLTV
jgi:N-acetylmuramoyl-L-alanine amidase